MKAGLDLFRSNDSMILHGRQGKKSGQKVKSSQCMKIKEWQSTKGYHMHRMGMR